MNPIALAQALALVAIANSAPVIAKLALGKKWERPIDGGLILSDGQPLLGQSKTWRGLVFSVVLTAISSVLIGLTWQTGALIAAATMAGDLFSSFFKRRLGLRPSSMALGFDQIPESMFPLAISTIIMPLSYLDVLVGTALFVVLALLLSRVFFALGLRDRPH